MSSLPRSGTSDALVTTGNTIKTFMCESLKALAPCGVAACGVLRFSVHYLPESVMWYVCVKHELRGNDEGANVLTMSFGVPAWLSNLETLESVLYAKLACVYAAIEQHYEG